MKIGMQVWGSDGDIRPMIALGAGLKDAGHEVTISVASVDGRDYSSLCYNTGIRFWQDLVYTEPPPPAKDEKPKTLMEMSAHVFSTAFVPYIPKLYETAKRLCSENDIVIGHFMCHYLKIAAIKAGKPHVCVSYYPGSIPMKTRQPDGMPWLGRAMAGLQWGLISLIVDAAMRPYFGPLFEQEGLGRVPDIVQSAWMSTRLNLVACSTAFYGEPQEWKDDGRVKITGYMSMPGKAEPYELPQELKRFLEGEKAVFITLGSVISVDPERIMDKLVEASRIYGGKVVIQTASQRYPAGSERGNVYFSGHMPHAPLLPHCSCVVHHCGVGTTHTVAAAGLPSVPVAFIPEQAAWGAKLHRSKAGVKPLSYARLNPKSLARAMREAATSQELKGGAIILAAAMAKENGVKAGVALIEGLR